MSPARQQPLIGWLTWTDVSTSDDVQGDLARIWRDQARCRLRAAEVTVAGGGRSRNGGQCRGHGPCGCSRRSGRRCDRCRAGHRGNRRAARTAACQPGDDCPRARHRRTPARRQQRLPEAVGQSLAGRQPGTGPRTAAQVRSSRAGDAAPGQILANRGHVGARLAPPQRGEALRDARDSLAVTEDFQGHL